MEKITYVSALSAVIAGQEMTPEIKEKLEALLASLSKKSAGERKPTKAQLEKAKIDAELTAKMLEAMEDGVSYTISTMLNTFPALAGLNVSKVTNLARQLKDAGAVVRTESKGKAYYTKA